MVPLLTPLVPSRCSIHRPQAHDVRYAPLEFNGWTQRHWTLPFEGERFSLVWFTPNGCEVPGLDLCREMRAKGHHKAAVAAGP